MNLVLSLGVALGALLLYEGLTAASSARSTRSRRLPGSVTAKLLAVSVGAGALGLFVASAITSSLVVGAAAGVLGVWLPFARERSLHRARIRQAQAEWPDVIAGIVASLRAGMSLAEACETAAERGGTALRPGFRAFTATYRATGNFRSSIEALRARLEDPIADRIGVALVMAHEVGGTDLIRVLRTLGDLVRNDLNVRREIEARWSWAITAARLAAAAPWLVLVLMSLQPEASRAYASPSGAAVVTVGAVATFGGYRLMLRAARLPEDRRLT